MLLSGALGRNGFCSSWGSCCPVCGVLLGPAGTSHPAALGSNLSLEQLTAQFGEMSRRSMELPVQERQVFFPCLHPWVTPSSHNRLSTLESVLSHSLEQITKKANSKHILLLNSCPSSAPDLLDRPWQHGLECSPSASLLAQVPPPGVCRASQGGQGLFCSIRQVLLLHLMAG